jgi:hypothetical protein
MRTTILRLIVTVLAVLAIGRAAKPLLVVAQERYRIEIVVERNAGQRWLEIDPRLVLDRDDRLRFRVKSSFEGFLYVTYQSTSGKYDVLFPGQATGQQNKIQPGKEYIVPQTSGSFRVVDPPGQEIVYFLMSPVELASPPRAGGNPGAGDKPRSAPTAVPRCDDATLRTRGDCIDVSAGPKPVGDTSALPSGMAGLPNLRSRELNMKLDQNTSVISSAEAVTGPVVYEVRLSHK